jgi:hypothetical protein
MFHFCTIANETGLREGDMPTRAGICSSTLATVSYNGVVFECRFCENE